MIRARAYFIGADACCAENRAFVSKMVFSTPKLGGKPTGIGSGRFNLRMICIQMVG